MMIRKTYEVLKYTPNMLSLFKTDDFITSESLELVTMIPVKGDDFSTTE